MFGWKKKDKETPAGSKGATATAEKATPPKAAKAPKEAPKETEDLGDLKVKIKDRQSCAVTLSVEVPAAQVKKATEDSFRRVQGKAKMPGFRPGKAPMEMIKKNFSEVAWDDALDHLLRDAVYTAVVQENIAAVTTPVVDKIDGAPDKTLKFEVKVECAPQVEVKDYKGIPLSETKKTVTDEDLAKRLEEIRESNSKLVLSKAGAIGPQHFAVVDYEAFLDGQPLENGKAQNQLIEMSASQNVAGFTEGLMGAKDGETKDIEVSFPDTHPQKNLAGKKVIFKATVTAIKEKELPALDDEFAKDLGLSGLDDLKSRIKQDLETGAERQGRQAAEKQIIDGLLQRNTFDVPPSQVEDRSSRLTQQLKDLMLRQGATEADWSANEAKMKERNRPEAERQVRLSYILGKIAEVEKIEPTEAEVDAHIQKIVEGSRPEQKKEVEAWTASRRDSIIGQLREEKLFDFLIKNAANTGAPSK